MDAELLPGIGGYTVERALGSGGMGRVYLCKDATLDRHVAIKVLQPELLEQADMRARFLREAKALARVVSPNVVAVHAVGEDAVSGPFVVMEFLDGEDLSDRLKREKKLPWRECIEIARGAVAGLKAAEGAGIVHRDVKPANLFVVKGVAKLTDFGLAREVQGAGAAGVTQAGIVVGTPAYLAPEVIKGSPANHASDLYSLGATLFHLVSGHPPFTAEAPLEVIAQAVRDKAPRLDAVAPDVPAVVADLVERMLEKEPGLRPPDFRALDDALRALLDGANAPTQRTMAFGTPLPVNAGLAPVMTTGGMPTMDVPVQPPAPSSSSLASSLLEAPPGSSPTNLAEISSPSSSLPRLRPPSGTGAVVKTATLTVMFTDIAGYTERTSRVSREESARWLALHDQLLQPVFKGFSGKVVKTLGDAFLVTFPSPTDAVLCACAVQDRLWMHNNAATTLPEDAIHVRAALSAGEVRLHKGDIFGEPVNIASRLEHIASPGEVVISDAVYATMNAAEVKLVSRGEHTLKGIARPVVVYAAVPDGVPGQPPFGGRTLGRVRESAVDVMGSAAAGVARQKAQDVIELVKRGDKRVLAAAALLVVAVVVFVVLLLSGDSREKRIDHGEAKTVLEELDQTADTNKTALDWTLAGHARLALDQRERAFAAYKHAVEKGSVDDRMKRAALQALGKKDDDGAKEVLAAWSDKGIEKELRNLEKSDDWWPRSHALAILELRKVADDDDRMSVGLHNLESDACADRKVGVAMLKKSGKGDDVTDALKKLRADAVNNACLMFDLGSAEDAVKKRTAGK